MRAPLREAIESVIARQPLTYRGIALAINQDRLFLPRDGSFVATEQVRAAVRESPTHFVVDRRAMPHRVGLNPERKKS
jgi:hypothetical protein